MFKLSKYLAKKKKVELIDMVKELFIMLCVLTFIFSFFIGVLLTLVEIV